ncbi:MAG: agmatinase [Firmicutes bacterium]|jgi:agmatinase|nr:agmatinase [Bacillota bacterium]
MLRAETELYALSWESPRKFLGCAGLVPASRIVIFGAPLDATASYRPGARFGPARIREVSQVLEEFSPVLGADIASANVCDLGDLVLPLGDVTGSLEIIATCSRSIIESGRIPLMLGGEHLVTLPAVRAASSVYPGLVVVGLDAHLDRRDEYLGQKLSHATVLRRVSEAVGEENVFHVGARSWTPVEIHGIRDQNALFQVEKAAELLAVELGDRPVYVSIDIDILDPAYAPGTGAPEPGGITSAELLGTVRALAGMNVVAADLVEVSPPYDSADITAIAAAKIVREAVIALGSRRGRGGASLRGVRVGQHDFESGGRHPREA